MIAQDMLHLGHHFDGRQRYVEDLTLGRDLSLHGPVREESMSFQVVRHEHPNIFVVNTQTYETYQFTVGDNVMLSFDGEAHRTAIAFLAQSKTKSVLRR
jgi:metallophosphoesterase superfamily enzyme